jgi:hypothetical protein
VVETVDGTFAYKADGSSTVVKEVVEDMDAATILALYSGTATVGNNDHDVFVYEVESHIMGETRHPRWATGQWHANDTVDEGRNSWHTYVLPITGQDEVDSDQAITEFLAYAAEHMDETFHVPHFKGWDKQRGVLAFARATDNVKLPKSWAKMIALIKSL